MSGQQQHLVAATFSDQVKRTEISSENGQEAIAKTAKSKSSAIVSPKP